MARSITLTEHNLAVLTAAGHPIYLIKTDDAPAWSYHRQIRVLGRPELTFKRHLLMYGTRGHQEALELELVSGTAPTRSELLGETLVQEQ